MLIYATLQARSREFLAATGLMHDEFARVLPAFAAAYAVRYPPDKTWEGKVRQRQSGGGAKGVLSQMEDKLLFILYLLNNLGMTAGAQASCHGRGKRA